LDWIKKHAPASTTATYGVYSKQYLEFTTRMGVTPKSQLSLCLFMKDTLETRGLARSTLVNVIPAAVEDLFRFDTTSPARDANGKALLTATKKTIMLLTKPSVPKKPVLRQQLEEMANLCPARTQDVRDMFMLILMFVGFLRESEAVGLKNENVWIETGTDSGKEALYVEVTKSKTDQFSETATIVIGACPKSVLCPVAWYRLYCSKHLQSPFLFHKLTRVAGQQLAKTTPNFIVKKWLGLIKVDPAGYGSHSLRRGGATAAACAKVRMHVVKRHGRWRSDAVYLYIVDGLEEQLGVSAAVLGH
jgi:integrase